MTAAEVTEARRGEPEEELRRIRAALAEVGYGDPALTVLAPAVSGAGLSVWCSTTVPPEVHWRATAIAGSVTRCWPCWSTWRLAGFPAEPITCDHDPLTSPWPPVVSDGEAQRGER